MAQLGARRTLMKLGFSQHPSNRISIANYDGWGGYDDWRLVAQGRSPMAGKLESDLHRNFENARVDVSWVRNGRLTKSREAFAADVPEACAKLAELCGRSVEIVAPHLCETRSM